MNRRAVAPVERVGSRSLAFLAQAFDMMLLCVGAIGMAFLQLLRGRLRVKETRDALYVVGVQSLPVILFSLSFLSLVMIAEFSFHMKLVLRQDSLVPSFSTLLILRELGPVVTALLLTSRAGASIAAEIGTMKLTDQLDALEMLGIDLLEYLMVPRWYACVVASICLSVIAFAVASIGGALMASIKLGYPIAQYMNTMFIFVRPVDLAISCLKAAIFGAIIPVIASYHGFNCERGSRGVGNAATRSVVQSSIWIIIADFALTFMFA